MDDRKIQVIEGQSLIDIAIQESGDVEGLSTLSLENGIPFSGDLDYQTPLIRGNVIDEPKRRYYQHRKIKPTTDTEPSGISDGIFANEFESNFE